MNVLTRGKCIKKCCIDNISPYPWFYRVSYVIYDIIYYYFHQIIRFWTKISPKSNKSK
jgi:hypothetical protein